MDGISTDGRREEEYFLNTVLEKTRHHFRGLGLFEFHPGQAHVLPQEAVLRQAFEHLQAEADLVLSLGRPLAIPLIRLAVADQQDADPSLLGAIQMGIGTLV